MARQPKPKPPPVCGFTLDGIRCRKRGDHRCAGRVRHVMAFFTELLFHTKGEYARKRFIPAKWQAVDVLAPLIGEVIWSEKWERYVRRYRTLYLTVARKNGKSELLAGLVLYLLCADDEEGAEIYGMALDAGQAGIVFHVAQRMVALSPVLRSRLTVMRGAERISDETTASFYQVVAGDAEGNLGENPSGAYIDELLTQRDRELYDAIRTGMGTRAQPLLMLATTAENDPSGFAATERDWSERVLADPELEPDRLVVLYRADEEDDWTRPSTWKKANPALGDFLEYRTLESECRTAQKNPAAERSFKQYRLNQPVSRVGRAIAINVWDDCQPIGETEGRECYAGMDLATTQDLAAYALVFPDAENECFDVLWRHFCPARRLGDLSRRTGGKAELWVARGELIVTDSTVTDYGAIKAALEDDRDHYVIREVAYDPWNAVQLAVDLSDEGWVMMPFSQGARNMSSGTAEMLRLIAAGTLRHGGNGLARWQAGNAVTRQDATGNVKFDRQRSAEKIDGIVAAVMGLDRALRHSQAAQDYLAAGF